MAPQIPPFATPLKHPPATQSLAPNTNGDLPDHRQKQIEAGLATYQSVLAERDQLDGKLSEACKTIASLSVQLESLKSVVNMMESSYNSGRVQMEEQVKKYQEQRDEAVALSAKYDGIIESIYSVLHNAITGKVNDPSTT